MRILRMSFFEKISNPMRKQVISLLLFACACTLMAQEIPVSDAAGLAAIATQCATDGCQGKTYVLNADIDLSSVSPWTPIGTASQPFKGRLNGNGHAVKGLHLFAGTDGIGLFGHVAAAGRIDSLGVCGSTIVAKNKRRIGALAGVCAGQINQCWSSAYMAAAGNAVGGLVGELTATGTITDAYHSGLIYNANDTIGGIAGINNGGTLRRVYNTGYAKNGKALVGLDKNGQYPDCFYDRKLYYQESGIVNDQYTPVDVTEDMFSLYTGSDAWWQDLDRYPILSAFAGTDAALLSAAPMYIDATGKDPVNHANDLTEDFTLFVKNGITWKCQNKRSEDWIQISGNHVTVIRPCAETDVLVDVKKGNEARVVYMRPRRLEDLQPGLFTPMDGRPIHGFCYNSYERVKEDISVQPAERGWTDADYHYQVIRYEVTVTDTVPKDTLLKDAGSAQYEAWYNKDTLPTNEPGHYIVRSFVHDEGCVRDWLENKSGFEYIVFGVFIPGTIVSGKDTILLTASPVYVDVASKTYSQGGGGEIEYWWNVSVNNADSSVIPDQKKPDLTHYAITSKGVYRFTRGSRDSICYTDSAHLAWLGYYTYYVFDAFNPGEISKPNDLTVCTPSEAKTFVVKTTAATGGVEDKGYSYQWFSVSGTDTTAIPGATAQNLDLKTLTLEPGKTYLFVRKAWDNTRFTTWTLSRNTLRIYIKKTLVPGAIQDGELPAQCVAYDASGATMLTVTVAETTPASGESSLEYRWTRMPGNKIVGNQAQLNYTFPLSEITLGTTYSYVRYVRNEGCDWMQSDGKATQYYGRGTYGEVTITVCSEDLPYSFQWVDGKTYTFKTAGETQLLHDLRGDCPADTLFRIATAAMPTFKMDDQAHLCQETGTIVLNFEKTSGLTNVYKVTYSPDLSIYMGMTGATGTITTDNTIILKNIPPIGTGDLYLDLQLGYTDEEGAAGVCFSAPHRMQLYFSLGGYVHDKYGRVLFVDNNPDNHLLPGATEKLKFAGYQWYRNGEIQIGKTDQYYHEDGRQLKGVYYVQLTDVDGRLFRSCDVEMVPDSASNAPLHSAVYPVPVGAGEPLTVEAEGAVQIYSFSGECVTRIEVYGKQTLTAPRVTGIYQVHITAPDGTVVTHKLIVK